MILQTEIPKFFDLYNSGYEGATEIMLTMRSISLGLTCNCQEQTISPKMQSAFLTVHHWSYAHAFWFAVHWL